MGPSHFTRSIEQFFQADVARFTAELGELDEKIDSEHRPEFDTNYQRLWRASDEVRQACWRMEDVIGADNDVLAEVRHRYQESIAPWFDQSPLMFHAKTKPRGYAGDFEMLIAIYEGKPKATGLGGYIDLYFLNTELGRAVPARMQAVRDFVAHELESRAADVSILNVACGPCWEYGDGVQWPQGRNTRITCVDYDQDALDYVASRVPGCGPDAPAIRGVRYNALRMRSGRAFAKQYGKHDIIYSVGLADYVPDRLLVPMLRGWGEILSDEGLIFVAFKDAERYDKIDYQWLVEWHFLQRRESDCRKLLKDAGFQVDTMSRDATGIIMNFVVRASGQTLRFDDAHAEVEAPAAPGSVAAQRKGLDTYLDSAAE